MPHPLNKGDQVFVQCKFFFFYKFCVRDAITEIAINVPAVIYFYFVELKGDLGI